MFIDRSLITVRSGAGGNGRSAFRREKYVPEGGPSGGDGGRGAHVIAVVDHNLQTLIDFRYRRNFVGDNGGHGDVKNMHGKNAEDLVIRVPPGTVCLNDATGQLIADLTEHGQTVVLARGGRGGRGNARFASATHRTPEYAEKGEPGEERTIRLELRMIASVGLIGFPNAGKSTLLSVVSAAKPKIANYPFTTLQPNLGVVRVDDQSSFVMADIPGIVEGASTGVGLGHDFLRHIERTRMLLHIVDVAAVDGRDPLEDFITINRELVLYSEELGQRPQFAVLNKVDLPQADEHVTQVQQHLEAQGFRVFVISAMTRVGVDQLLKETAAELARLPEMTPLVFTPAAEEMLADEDELRISREDDGAWRVQAKRLDRLVAMTDFMNRAAIQRFQTIMRHSGVDDALRQAGTVVGDTVRISDMEFTFADQDDDDYK